MTTKESAIFAGVYGIPEAATYLSNTPPFTDGLRINPSKLRYWIRASVPYVAPSGFPTRQRLITFLDLISMRMIAIMRSRDVKLREIKKHEAWLRKEFGIKWPFVSREMWTFGGHVFVQFEERLWASSKSGQEAMEFLKDWLSKVEVDMRFDEYNIASSWYPYKDIYLDPKIQFGTPCINETRIPTRTIWRKIKSGDSPEILANLYDLSMTQIEHAIQWERRLETNGNKTIIHP